MAYDAHGVSGAALEDLDLDYFERVHLPAAVSPEVYRRSFAKPPPAPGIEVSADPYCLAQLKDYRSLMPMAQEAKKPMFLLRPADGAIGGHQGAVRQSYEDFLGLAQRIWNTVASSPP